MIKQFRLIMACALLTSGLTSGSGSVSAQTAAATPAPAVAATAFQAIPDAETAKYHFDFTKDYFPSDAAEKAAEAELKVEVAQIQSYKGKVLASPGNLYSVLKLSDQFSVLFSRVYWDLNLRYSINTKDTTDRDHSVQLDSTLSPQLSFITNELQEITPSQEQRFMTADPRLKVYTYAIYQTIRSKPHTLNTPQEELIESLQPLMTQWQADEYNLLEDRAPWGKVADPETGKLLDVRQDQGQIGNSAVRTVRAEGAEKSNAAFAAQRDLYAFDFINVAKSLNKIAQLRHFKNGQADAFFNLYLTYPGVQKAFDTILANGGLNKQFQTLHRDRVAKFTGYDTVHYWDMTVVPPGVVKPQFTIDEATAAIKASTAYLGPEWNGELSSLLDPANGRLDIVSGANRVPNAFSIPSPGTRSVFYSYGYEGYLEDVVTLAHESGHVVHSALQDNNHVLPTYADGPRYFTESYAILDEYVVMDSLYQKEKDPGRKVYYLEQLMQDLMSFYGTTRIASIEKGVYEGVDNGTVKDADDMDALTFKIGEKSSIWYDIDPEVKNLWQEVPHYYSSPTYYVNYVFASLLSQTYFAMYKKDPIGFGKRFTALERNGFNDTPDHLLKRFLGIDMSDPKTYDAVFDQQRQYISELQNLYQQVPVPTASKTASAQ